MRLKERNSCFPLITQDLNKLIHVLVSKHEIGINEYSFSSQNIVIGFSQDTEARPPLPDMSKPKFPLADTTL